jgi:tRNA1Val (adenine37-N6)-methyltransferase
MANDYFKFHQFTVRQDRCAMKVGTDGTLLGAWAQGGQTVLDIGTGTGLIALMMAQRFPKACVVGIDIDHEAVSQARENVAESPFRNIEIVEADVKNFSTEVWSSARPESLTTHRSFDFDTICSHGFSTFNAIVSNPPYFVDSLECPDNQRTQARHTSSLTYRDLMSAVGRLLSDDGEFSVVIPFDSKKLLESEAALAGLFKVRECAVRTTPCKLPKRYLLAFRKHPAALEVTEGIIEIAPNVRSEWYQQLTKDFYIK